jgi:hypothetical protein
MRGFGRSLVTGAVVATVVAGCGSSGHVGGHLDVRGQTTPANAVSMSVSVIGHQVSVSPKRLGAGQMIFNIVNTDATAQTLVARPSNGHGTTTKLGTVAPGGTSQIKVELKPGNYLLGSPLTGETAIVSGHKSLTSATLKIGAFRSGGDNAIDQP